MVGGVRMVAGLKELGGLGLMGLGGMSLRLGIWRL